MYGMKKDWELEPKPRHMVLDDYTGAKPRWCAACGDLAVLSSVQRLVRDEQLLPEKTVFVSGIGCSSRFPHYMKTYGFHGLHGRAFPVACGIRSRRPDVDIFVATGDGDCCAIGAGHWVHAIRYNMNMTVMLLDNHIYGLTKMQSSPTSPMGNRSNTHPRGTFISPLNPLSVTLSITNASFVAQTVDWNPPHLYATLKAAHRHDGLSFVRVLQRCPHFMPHVFDSLQQNPDQVTLLKHEDGIDVDEAAGRIFKTQVEHDPSDLLQARYQAERQDATVIGLLYRNRNAERYDKLCVEGLGMNATDRLEAAQNTMDRFLI
jgi:2-oxoglutarate ferredoxin oxidoreductase subunit beta